MTDRDPEAIAHIQRMVKVIQERNEAGPWGARPPSADYSKHIEEYRIVKAKADLLKMLSESPGWKLIDGIVRAKRQELLNSVKIVKHKDLIRLQAELSACDFLLDIIPQAIEDGETAKQRLNDIAAWIKEQMGDGEMEGAGDGNAA